MPYALAAMFFLFIAMIFNLSNNERVANGFAIITYYFLIESVVAETINLRKTNDFKKKRDFVDKQP